MDRKNYIAGVDGLRAIAVMTVVMFHGAFSKFTGGFVGVDVFFVISGFLITRLIADEVTETGRFDFAQFYLRRAHRLFPALFFVFVLTFIAAFVLFDPQQFRRFGGELQYALVSLSNVFFWAESGYFDTAANFKPLLHTWSLAVEEQFYLVWPLVLVLLLKRGRWAVWIGLLAVFAVSLWANTKFSQETIFYLTPFRMFEFAIGAALVWIPRSKSRIALEVMMLAGLTAIGYATHHFDEKTVFPSFNALIPCAGAALVILSTQARVAGLIVRNPAAFFIGRISYSIYLIHWPLMAFYRYWRVEPIATHERWQLIIASVVLGYLLFRFVEQPFRVGRGAAPRWSAPAVGFVCMLLTVVLIVPSSSVWANGGWSWRVGDKGMSIGDNPADQLNDIVGRLGCTTYCEFGNPNGPKVLLVGDSHSDQYSKALKLMGGDTYHFYQVYSPSCFFGKTMWSWSTDSLGPLCRQANEKLHEVLKTVHFDAIIVSERWPGYKTSLMKGDEKQNIPDLNALYPTMLNDIGALYAGFKGPIVFVGHAPETNTACYRRPQFVPMVCPATSKIEHAPFVKAFTEFAAATPLHVSLVEPIDTICPHGGDCMITDKSKHLLYTDSIHLSVYGAELVAPQIIADLPRAGSVEAAAHHPSPSP